MMNIIEMQWGSKVEMTVGTDKLVDKKGSVIPREIWLSILRGWRKHLQEGVQELTFLNTL